MQKTKLERFFEDLLAEPGKGDAARTFDARPELAAALATVSPTPDRVSAMDLASHLDGALAAGETVAFAGKLAAEFHELEAAQHFLTRVSVEATPAPPELVAAAVADSVLHLRKSATAQRPLWRWPEWGRQWGWAGGTIAAVLLALVISDNLKEKALPPAPRVTEDAATSTSPSATAPNSLPADPATPPVALVPPQTPVAPSQPAPSPAPSLGEAPAPAVTVAQSAQPAARESAPEVAPLPPPPPPALAPPPPPPPAPPASMVQAPPPVTTAITNRAPPPPRPQTGRPEVPEQVLITGSLIRGSAALGVPITSLEGVAGTERYPDAALNPVKLTQQDPVSTFSVDVDTSSYSNVRRFIADDNSLPPPDAVRAEEMINYFDYHYAVPRDRSQPFLPSVAVYPTPWNPNTQILHIGIKGFDIPKSERPRANLVFLIDTSGSMNEPNKLPLLKRSFSLLVDQLRPEDRVSIVVYAGSAGVVLEPTPGSEKARIMTAIDRLQAGGSTAGGAGIRKAYELAKANFDKDGINRVLLATDGDFNVGITDPDALEKYIAGERSSGVFLTVLGFGTGNYNDLTMQKLAQAGNGFAAYIDTFNEARKVFVEQVAGTLFTIAKDVKIQVEFNPARVAEYRLIGYETRLLNEADFNNDKVDAGDIGSGHTVTALYEITPADSMSRFTDPRRYGRELLPGSFGPELAFVKIRYKLPAEDTSRLITRPVTDRDVQRDFARLPDDFRFAAAVAGAGQLLRKDPYIKSFDFERAAQIAEGAKGEDSLGYRREFIELMEDAEALAQTEAADESKDRAAHLVEPGYAAPNPPRAINRHTIRLTDYPADALNTQEEGVVKVQYIVLSSGAVGDCLVIGSSGSDELDEAACGIVKNRWKFRPATLTSGRRVAMWQSADVEFKLP